MNHQIAQFLWVGPGLSPMESMCLRSFLEIGYEVHLYSYERLENVPRGVIHQDAREILAESQVFRGAGAKGGSLAPFADRFRYNLLFKKGGWWFDTDHLAVRLMPEPRDLYISSQWDGINGQYANVGAIWCKAGDTRVEWLKDKAEEILLSDERLEYTSLGPMLMNKMIEKFSAQKNVAPWYEFCPFHLYSMDRLVYKTNMGFFKDLAKNIYHRFKEIIQPGFKASYIRNDTRAVHLWNEIWRVEGLSKFERYHPLSFYGRNQRKYSSASRMFLPKSKDK